MDSLVSMHSGSLREWQSSTVELLFLLAKMDLEWRNSCFHLIRFRFGMEVSYAIFLRVAPSNIFMMMDSFSSRV
jgi:hypothetical protein